MALSEHQKYLASLPYMEVGGFKVDRTWKRENNPTITGGGDLWFNPADQTQSFRVDRQSGENSELSQYVAGYGATNSLSPNSPYTGTAPQFTLQELNAQKQQADLIAQMNAGKLTEAQATQMANAGPTAPVLESQTIRANELSESRGEIGNTRQDYSQPREYEDYMNSDGSNGNTASSSYGGGASSPSRDSTVSKIDYSFRPGETVDSYNARIAQARGEAPMSSSATTSNDIANGASSTYTVKSGDTLSKIAKALGVPMASITGYKSGDINKIGVGEVLTINAGSKGTSSIGGGAQDVSTITPSSPLGITSPTGSPGNASSTGQSTSTNIDAYIAANTQPETEAGKKESSLTKELEKLVGNTSGQAKMLADEEKKAGVQKLNADLTSVNNQIKTALAEKNALNVDNEGKPITMNSIIGRNAQVNAVYDAKIYTLTAQANMLMGNIELAQENAQKAVDAKYAPILEQIKIKEAQLQLLQPKLTKEEKIRADAQAQMLADQKEATTNKMANEKELRSALLDQMLKYPDAQISLTDTLETANAKIKSNSTIYRETVRPPQYASGGSGGGISSGSANSGIVNTILASGKFTKDQAAVIANAINNGEDPMTVIRNNAKNLMSSPEATDLSKLEKAQRAMLALDSDLKDFYSAGGKTSIFSGTYENALNKLGTLTDPNLVKLATKIKTSLQSYRNAVSGTAYSEQEGRDIASIFPGINKTEGLNRAIMESRLESFDTDIDGMYRGTLGSAYDQLKTGYSGGESSGISEEQAKQAVMENVRANPASVSIVTNAFRDNPTWTYADVLQLLP